MQFPAEVQSALLLDRAEANLDQITSTFVSVMRQKEGAEFRVLESNPGLFLRLFGADDLMITFELIPNPGDPHMFQQPLASSITGILCPDMRDRVMRHKGMILVNVSHGLFGGVMNDPKIAGMMSALDANFGGANLPQFQRRLAVCQLASRIAAQIASPLAVHWTQSNQLIAGERFEEMAAQEAPNSLHIHPWLFAPPTAPGEERLAGIRTFGAQHFIGREIVIQPNILPIPANYQVILAFVTLASMDNGYVIPNGDTFGPEDRSLSYRVTWHDAEDGHVAQEGDGPTYELTPLLHRKYGFEAPDHAPMGNVIADHVPPVPTISTPTPPVSTQSVPLPPPPHAMLPKTMVQGVVEPEPLGPATLEQIHAERALTPVSIPAMTYTDQDSAVLSGAALRAKLFGRKEP